MSSDARSVTLSAYREVLANPGVSPDDDFFELGGDSVQAIEAVSLIEVAMGAEIPVAWFFTYTTAGELAEAIAAEATADQPL
jgi:nonribosomal peptide synthetase MxcG